MVTFALFVSGDPSGDLLGGCKVLVRQGLEQLGHIVNAGHSGIFSLRPFVAGCWRDAADAPIRTATARNWGLGNLACGGWPLIGEVRQSPARGATPAHRL
jgi:hypothetical protein